MGVVALEEKKCITYPMLRIEDLLFSVRTELTIFLNFSLSNNLQLLLLYCSIH